MGESSAEPLPTMSVAELRGLAVEDLIATLRVRLLPLVTKSHRIARENLEPLRRMRQVPSLDVERAEAVPVVLIHAGPSR
jgi:hypothetical protein